MNKAFDIKYQDHLKLYVLLKDVIRFEEKMTSNRIPFYSEINEQASTAEGIRYFILDVDRGKVDEILVKSNIIASTETISNFDFSEQKKLYKVYWLAAIIVALLIVIGLIMDSIFKNIF